MVSYINVYMYIDIINTYYLSEFRYVNSSLAVNDNIRVYVYNVNKIGDYEIVKIEKIPSNFWFHGFFFFTNYSKVILKFLSRQYIYLYH